MESFARQSLQTFEINFVAAIKFDVFLGKILADAANEFHRRKKTRRDRRMAGRAAEQAWIFRVRSFDGIRSAVVPTIKTLM